MLYLICEMLLKVNYFAAGKSKGLISRFFIKDYRFMYVCGILHNLFSNDFLHSSFM